MFTQKLGGINMIVRDIIPILEAEVVTAADLEAEIHSACGSDMMSDVLAYVKDQSLLMTGLINSQVIRTAEMMDIKAVCFVRGKRPTEDIIALAKKKDITVLTTNSTLFVSCGKLYEKGLKGRRND